MSLTKRIFIDRDPAYAEVRERNGRENAAYREQFGYRIPINRRNPRGGKPHWDPYWPRCLSVAADDLEIEGIYVNSGMFLRTAEERDRVRSLADIAWKLHLERLAARERR